MEPRPRKKKEGVSQSLKYRAPTNQEKRKKDPHQEKPRGDTQEMGKRAQAGHTSMPSAYRNNQTKNWTERDSRGGRHKKYASKKTKSGVPNTLKRSMLEFGAVLSSKEENIKEIFQNFQESVLQYVVEKYSKGVDIVPLIRKIEDVDLSSK